MFALSSMLKFAGSVGLILLDIEHFAAAENNQIKIKTREKEPVIYERKVRSAFSSSDDDSIKVNSNIPVTILRYNDQDYLIGETPIDPGETYIFVKTNCPSFYNRRSLKFRYKEDDDGRVNKITLRASPRPRKNEFLRPSTFEATWDYTSFWCRANADKTESADEEDELSEDETATEVDSMDLKSEERKNNDGLRDRKLMLPNRTLRKGGKCRVNLELLMDGCEINLDVKSPRVRVKDVDIRDEKASKNEDDECVTDYEAELVFPGRAQKPKGRSNQMVRIETLSEDNCVRAIEGRPFLDSRNHLLQATAHVGSMEASWAKGSDKHRSCSKPSYSNTTLSLNSEIASMNLKSNWIKRALGEHASVASFAAFTLSLMTNNAPPTLVRDSLRAALDEVNHAIVSFEVSSLFAGQVVEPGPLPPSSHEFVPDMSSLALGAAREGCIDETLSALAAAEESDGCDRVTNSLPNFDASMLREGLRVIALDEGRHSILAWKTVRWACSVDSDACAAVRSVFDDLSNVNNAIKKRIHSGTLQDDVKSIYHVLVPVVLGDVTSSGINESFCGENKDDTLKSTSKEVIANIIRGVLCDT